MLNHNLCSEIISEEDNYTSQKDQIRNQTNIMESISLTNEKQLEDPVSPTKIIPQKMSNQ
jgi:hypothetical protein